MGRVTYLSSRWYPVLVYVSFAGFVLAACFLVALSLTRPDQAPPWWFSALWCLAVIWNAYWFLFRISYRLDLDSDVLRWYAPLRHGAVPLNQLCKVRPSRAGGQIQKLDAVSHRPVLVLARKGFVAFAAQLSLAAPHVDIRIGWAATLLECLPGATGFGSDSD